MLHPVSVQALPDYQIHIKYSDGAEGDVDLSEFAGRGVFAAWNDLEFFRLVHIGEHRQIRWNDEVELCPDAIYMRLTGKTPKEYFASRDAEPVHA
jgi:hypothetical protein